MPLLGMDENGEIVEYGFGREKRRAEVTPDDGSLIVGEYSKKELNARQKAELKKRQEEHAKKVHAQKIANAKKQAELIKKANTIAANKKIAAKVRQERVRQNEITLARIKGGKDPYADSFGKDTVGPALVGFNTRATKVSKVQMNQSQGDYGTIRMGWRPVSRFNRYGNVGYSQPNSVPQSRLVRQIASQVKSERKLNRGRQNFVDVYVDPQTAPMGFKKLKRAVKKVTPKPVQKAVRKAQKVAGKAVDKLNPIKLAANTLKSIPLVKDVYKGVDKLTGGTLTSIERISKLPAKAVAGKKITKAELMESVVMAVKLGAIVVSGGSAVAAIGAASSSLKAGPLGKTSFGRTILSIGEIAGLATVGGTGLAQAMKKKATDMAASKAATEVGKKAGPLGAIAASAAVHAGAAGASGGGVKPVGDKIPTAATAQGAKTVAQASEQAAQKAAQELAKSGMKFSTEAAQAEAQRVVTEQAKALVAAEFKKKTGIPLDLAVKVSQGKMPTVDEIRSKVVQEMRNSPEHLKNELAKIESQMKNADPAMKMILKEKEKLMSEEIIRREQAIAIVEKATAEELVAHNIPYKEMAEKYVAEVDAIVDLSNRAQLAREKAANGGYNLEDRAKYGTEADLLEKEVIRRREAIIPLENRLAEMAILSEKIKEDGAARKAIAEYGGKTKYTEGMPGFEQKDTDDRHPLVKYMVG